MGDKTAIEWTDATWNPIIGCSRVGPGCDHCYAIGVVHREMSPQHVGLTIKRPGEPTDWTGEVRPAPQVLDKPLHWRRPRRIFVNSLSDLFHPDLPDAEIANVFAVMALAPQHTFQCLTKRPQRMALLLGDQAFQHMVVKAIEAVKVDREDTGVRQWRPVAGYPNYEVSNIGGVRRVGASESLSQQLNPRTGRWTLSLYADGVPKTLPVHQLVLRAFDPEGEFDGAEVCHRNGNKADNRAWNLRWGTRSENQNEKVAHGSRGGPAKLTTGQVEEIRVARSTGETQQVIADRYGVSRSLVSMIESGKVWAPPDLAWPLPNVWLGTSIESDRYTFRADHLRATPAAVRWVSAEPMLGPLPSLDLTGIDWVVVGGESGPGARPMHPDWARGLRDRCAGCPVCGTPMGEWAQRQGEVGVCLQGHRAGPAFLFKQWGDWDPMAPMVDGVYNFDGPNVTVLTDGQFFTTWDAWEKAGRSDSRLTRLLPTGMYRVGKKAAGRELDGRTWDEYPA